MSWRVLVCDDSSFARRQMVRALPTALSSDVSFAADGREALRMLREAPPDLLLLDLNMPLLDGYQVLAALRAEALQQKVKVLVASGDVQPQARARVMALGATGFLRKPVSREALLPLLEQLGAPVHDRAAAPAAYTAAGPLDAMDSYRELLNVAMGRAGDLLARTLDSFVELSIPQLNLFEGGDLHMTLTHVTEHDAVHAVSQGFVARELAGEAILIVDDASFDAFGRLLGYRGSLDETDKVELLMDMAGLLIGACLKGISAQLERPFSEGRPHLLGRNTRLEEMLAGRPGERRPMLAAEIGYRAEGQPARCELLLLFTQDSLPTLDRQLAALGGRQ